jgi:hypothetical protein
MLLSERRSNESMIGTHLNTPRNAVRAWPRSSLTISGVLSNDHWFCPLRTWVSLRPASWCIATLTM